MLAIGCGRVGFDPKNDATTGDGLGGGDSTDAVVRCTGPFGPAMPLTELNSGANEEGAALRDDGLEIIFASDRVGGFALYTASRADRSQPFGPPTQLPMLATGLDVNDPYLSRDGLTLYFNDVDVYVAKRADLDSAWGVPAPVAPFNTLGAFDGALDMTHDELTAYFSSDRPGTAGSQDIMRATRSTPTGVFGSPTIMAAASSTSYDCCPSVSGDGAHVMFTTMRSTNYEVFSADILSNGDLGPAVPVTEINTTFIDLDPFATRDDRYLGFASDRPGGLGNLDLYLMERSCP